MCHIDWSTSFWKEKVNHLLATLQPVLFEVR
jgi:hypothetical protein